MTKSPPRLGRRSLLLSSSLAAAALLISSSAWAELLATPRTAGTTVQIGSVTVRGVAFDNNGITMSRRCAAHA